MRRQLRAFVLVALLASTGLAISGTVGVDAFSSGAVAGRTVSVSIVGDNAAYLHVAARTGPHSCFVSQDANGLLSLSFGSDVACTSNGGGTGLNAGDGSTTTKYSQYAFHDLLLVTNRGTKTTNVWVNATTTSGSSTLVDVAKESATGQMTGADYATSTGTSLPLSVGSSLYVGVRVKSGTLSTGSVTGSVTIETRQ